MTKPWYKRAPDQLEEIRRELREHYPTLHVFEGENGVTVRGTFPISAPSGRVLDRWAIGIELLSRYPDELPVVRELDGRIPWEEKFHVESDGKACVLLPDERFRVFPVGAPFLDYLRGPVLSFFLGQSLVAMGEEWPFDEWGHGAKGVWQFYEELLGAGDRGEIGRYLKVLAKLNYKGHADCPCGSGVRIRDCHRDRIKELRAQIPYQVARRALQKLGLQKAPVRSKK